MVWQGDVMQEQMSAKGFKVLTGFALLRNSFQGINQRKNYVFYSKCSNIPLNDMYLYNLRSKMDIWPHSWIRVAYKYLMDTSLKNLVYKYLLTISHNKIPVATDAHFNCRQKKKKINGRGQDGELHNLFDGINGSRKQVQCFTTFSMKKLFIISNCNPLWSNLRPFHFRPCVSKNISVFFFKEESEILNGSKDFFV